MSSRVTAEEFERVVREGLPSGAAMGFEIVTLERGHAVLRIRTRDVDLRPGDTVAGPVLFALADLAMSATSRSRTRTRRARWSHTR